MIHGRGMKMILRAGWALVGLLLSLPAFGPPLAGVIAFLAVSMATGSTFSHVFSVLWDEPHGKAWMSVAALYCVYWSCIASLVVQFVLDKELWLVPLAIVAVVMASALVALQPWHPSDVPFTLGPFALLHVAFMATIAWPSFRKSAASPDTSEARSKF